MRQLTARRPVINPCRRVAGRRDTLPSDSKSPAPRSSVVGLWSLPRRRTPVFLAVRVGFTVIRLLYMEYEVEGPRPRGRPKRTWREVVEKDCQARKLNKEDAIDRSKWRELIKDVR